MKKMRFAFVLVVAMMLTAIVPAAAVVKADETLSAETFYSALQAEYEKYGMSIQLEKSSGTVYTQEALDYELAKVKELADSVEITTTVDTDTSVARSTLLTYTTSSRVSSEIGYVTIKVNGMVVANPAAGVVTGVSGISSAAVSPAKNFLRVANKGQQHQVYSLNRQYVHAIWYGDAYFQTVNSTGDTVQIMIHYHESKVVKMV